MHLNSLVGCSPNTNPGWALIFKLNQALGKVTLNLMQSYRIVEIDIYQETEEVRLFAFNLGYVGSHVNILSALPLTIHHTGIPPVLNFHRCE